MSIQTPISAPDLPDVDDFVTPKIIGIEKDDQIYVGLAESGILDHLAFCQRQAESFMVGGIRVDIYQVMKFNFLIQSVVHTRLHYKNWFFHFHCPPQTLADLVCHWVELGQASMYMLPESMILETKHEFTLPAV